MCRKLEDLGISKSKLFNRSGWRYVEWHEDSDFNIAEKQKRLNELDNAQHDIIREKQAILTDIAIYEGKQEEKRAKKSKEVHQMVDAIKKSGVLADIIPY